VPSYEPEMGREESGETAAWKREEDGARGRSGAGEAVRKGRLWNRRQGRRD